MTKIELQRTEPPAAAADAFDAKEFRRALSSFPTGVTLMTAATRDDEKVGIACNSFASLSLEPPLVSWGLRLNSKNLEAFRAADGFTVNVLAESQRHLSARFASSTLTSAEKFDGVEWTPGHAGAPVVNDCVANFECEKFAEHVAGDHVLFIGRVVRFHRAAADDSLVFYKGAYMMVAQSLRELVEDDRADRASVLEARRIINCSLLRLACKNGTEDDFAAIERNLEEIEACVTPEQRARRMEASLEFFRLISRAAHNEVLAAVSGTLSTVVGHVLRSAPATAPFSAELIPARRRILSCLRARDADAAEREMASYFEQLRKNVS